MSTNDEINILTTAISTDLGKIIVLQSEYKTKFTAYDTAKTNYTNSLALSALNPCSTYSSWATNISQECANKIWSDQKCTTNAPVVAIATTFRDLVSNAFTTSKSIAAADKTLCYGTTTNPIFNASTVAVSSAHNSDFISKSSSTWTVKPGTAATVSVTTVSGIDECIQKCAANTACTGSTYNTSTANICSSIIGPGILTPSVATNKAIIPKITDNLLTLNTLNTELMGIIDSIERELIKIQPNLDIENAKLLDTSLFETGFRADYETLLADRTKIANLLANYNDISITYDEKSLFADRENNSLHVWTIGTIIIFIFLIKYTFGLDSPAINTIFWITVIVLLGLTLSNPTGFIGLGILCLIFLSFIIYK